MHTGAAWASHPALSVIDNSTDFNKKIKRGIAAICGSSIQFNSTQLH